MKKTFEITRSCVTKLIVGVLMLAILGAALTGCGGASVQKSELEGNVAVAEGSETSQNQLNEIAEFLLNNNQAHQAFVAAYRGYDMLEEGFDMSADRPGIKDENGNYIANVEAAKAALTKYDTDQALAYDKLNADDVVKAHIADLNNVSKASIINKKK